MNKRHIIAGILGATLMASALPALAFAQDDDAFAPEGLEWILSSYASDDAMTEVPEGVVASLRLDAGAAGGSGGCNSFFGSYEITADTLTFGELGSTLALCAGPAQQVEDAYMALLPDVAGWAVDGKTLSLSDESGAVTLMYDEAPIEVFGSDVIAATAQLASLQVQVDELDANTADLSDAVESQFATVDNQINALRNRVKDNEAVLTDTVDQVDKLRTRVKDLENQYADLDERVSALEKDQQESE